MKSVIFAIAILNLICLVQGKTDISKLPTFNFSPQQRNYTKQAFGDFSLRNNRSLSLLQLQQKNQINQKKERKELLKVEGDSFIEDAYNQDELHSYKEF